MEYVVTWEDRYEVGENDTVFYTLEEAQEFADYIIEDGGWAEISDGTEA